MNDERIQELMNKALDNTITKEEQAEFESYLNNHPEIQKSYNELKKSVKLVGDLPDYEPSQNLKKNILNKIDLASEKNSEPNSQNTSNWIKNLFPVKNKIVFSFAFSVVIIFCVFLLWYTSDKTNFDKESISGYMGKSESTIDVSSSYYTDLIGIKSSLNIYQRKDTLMVVMDKKSSQDISVGYHFEPDFLSFIGIREATPTSPLVQKDQGKASVTIQDPSKVLMMFQVLKPTSTMDLQIRDSSRQIFRYKFMVGKK